ncbi:MAG: hypothetical protein L6R37_005435 [Teloschistes peruensis]|nr:MAG: hypothetical protein L6R37_005435 [Teloschistes peruensis]
MGWFTTPPPTDASNPSSPQPSSDGAFIAPDRTSRSKCYATRDSFFACLDKAGILDSIAEEEKAGKECGGLDREMGRECAASWVSSVLPGMGLTRWWVDGAVEVKYFKQRRVMEWKKQQTLNQIKAEGGWIPEGSQVTAATVPKAVK